MRKTSLLLLLALVVSTTAGATAQQTRDSILQVITGATMPVPTLNITKLGARGNGTTDCKPATIKG